MKQVNSFIFRTPSPVDEFVHESSFDDNNKECIFVQNDLFVLFNQERLNPFGVDTANAIIDGYSPQFSVTLNELKKNLSDEQLLSYIKSRHIQSRSELNSWLNSLSAEQKYLLDAVNEAKEVSNVSESTGNQSESV